MTLALDNKKFKIRNIHVTHKTELPAMPNVMKVLQMADGHPMWNQLAPALALVATTAIRRWSEGEDLNTEERLIQTAEAVAEHFLRLRETHANLRD